MSSRLFWYGNAVELALRSRRRWGQRLALRPPQIAELILRYLARTQADGGDEASRLATMDDYQIATNAGVSIRQTGELYDECGLGQVVRDVLSGLEQRGLVTIRRKAVQGRYTGVLLTERGARAVDLRPWYRRALAFFDPPAQPDGQPSDD